jgi:hypothetical protein
MTPEDLMVISGLYGEEPKNAPTAGGLSAEENGAEAPSYSGGLDLGVNPSRKRRTPLQNTMLTIADLFNISASRPNVFGQSALTPGSAYLGQSEEQANARQKTRMEEDPEGYQIDMNRAKVLSQKAYQETDPVKKAIYGREIKKLLPEETQGLDDLTAADMFTSNEKIELERLKQTGRLQLQQLKNSGNMDVAALKASSAEEINQAKLNTQWDIATLNNEYRKAIADGNNERAITVAQMITDRQTDLAMLNNAAKLKQTEMQQTGQNYRTAMQQEGAMSRTLAQNASREEIARMQADTAREQIAGRERVAQINADARIKSSASGIGKQQAKDDMDRANWANIEARHDYQNSRFNEAINLMSQYTVFGPVAGRASDWGWASSEALDAKGRIKSILTSAVEERLKAVREAAGTAKAADSEKEGARVIGYLTGDSTVPQETIMGALQDFMKTSDKALQLRKNELFGTKVSTQGQVLDVGQTTNVGGFKVTRRQ